MTVATVLALAAMTALASALILVYTRNPHLRRQTFSNATINPLEDT